VRTADVVSSSSWSPQAATTPVVAAMAKSEPTILLVGRPARLGLVLCMFVLFSVLPSGFTAGVRRVSTAATKVVRCQPRNIGQVPDNAPAGRRI
jgi:hypothetical protein